MSLRADIENLRRRRTEELHALHYTYLRTKRDLRRSMNPSRFIRRHLGVGMGVAAALGFVLAPKPAPRGTSESAGDGAERNGHLTFWQRALTKVLPASWRSYIPGMPKGEEPDDSAKQHASQNGGASEESAAGGTRHRWRAKRGRREEKGVLGMLLGVLWPVISILLKRVDVNRLVHDFLHRSDPAEGAARREAATASGPPADMSVADVGTVKPTDYDEFH